MIKLGRILKCDLDTYFTQGRISFQIVIIYGIIFVFSIFRPIQDNTLNQQSPHVKSLLFSGPVPCNIHTINK